MIRSVATRLGAVAVLLASMVAGAAPALASSYAVMPGAMNLTATFNSVGVEVMFTGDDNANATAALQFKKATDSAWRAGLPLWRTDGGAASPGRAFYGSALELDPGTTYNVRVTLADPDGVSGTAVLSGSINTRAENIASSAGLQPTYFVMANGNDANAGTSASTAWATLDKVMISAPAGAVVEIGPGYFKAASTQRTTPITLMAQYPAVDDSATPINPGKHTVIDSGVNSGPAVISPASITSATVTAPASTGDGFVYSGSSVYATARSTVVASSVAGATAYIGQSYTSGQYHAYRAALKFDTSAIPSTATITSAQLRLTAVAVDTTTAFDLEVSKLGWGAQDPISATTRQQLFGTALTAATDAVWSNTAAITQNQSRLSPTLDPSWINRGGTTYYGVRSSRDRLGSVPTGNELVRIATADSTNAALRPALIVTYTTSAGQVQTQSIGGEQPVATPWKQVSFTDPTNSSKTYAVWEWAATGMDSPTQLGYATTRAAEPKRLGNWTADTLNLATPAGWAKLLYTNQTYNYGFYTSGEDVYARFPGDVNPNTLYVTMGNTIGLDLNGPNIRLYGLELRQFKYAALFGPLATFGVVDHAQLVGNYVGVEFEALAGTPPTYGSDTVVQYSRIADSSLWTADHVTDPGIPWTFIKDWVANADGTNYATKRLGAWNETAAIKSESGGAKRVVVRHNTIDGSFDGVTVYSDGWTDRHQDQDMDVNANLIHHVSDDSVEPTAASINFRVWGNRFEDDSVVLSTTPTNFGPVYFFRNIGWRLGAAGVPNSAQGQPTYGNSTSGVSPMFKYDSSSSVQARIYVINNTLWADPSLSTSVMLGGGNYGGSATGTYPVFYLRNNIIHMTEYAFAVDFPGMWNEDYNNFSTTDASRGFKYNGYRYTTDVAGYRTASQQGAHTNLANTFVTTPPLNNELAGDVSLPTGSALIDAGVAVPNIADLAGVNYNGARPDIGADEH